MRSDYPLELQSQNVSVRLEVTDDSLEFEPPVVELGDFPSYATEKTSVYAHRAWNLAVVESDGGKPLRPELKCEPSESPERALVESSGFRPKGFRLESPRLAGATRLVLHRVVDA